MKVLLDTNILTHSAQPSHPMYNAAVTAIDGLKFCGDELFIAPQNLYECWVVATQPLNQNGMDMTVQETLAEISRIKGLFELLPESITTYALWERLVAQYRIMGKPAHD